MKLIRLMLFGIAKNTGVVKWVPKKSQTRFPKIKPVSNTRGTGYARLVELIYRQRSLKPTKGSVALAPAKRTKIDLTGLSW